MTMMVTTNGEVSHIYVGYKCLRPRPDGTFDPIELALAQLREDCNRDREEIMSKLKRWVYYRTPWR